MPEKRARSGFYWGLPSISRGNGCGCERSIALHYEKSCYHWRWHRVAARHWLWRLARRPADRAQRDATHLPIRSEFSLSRRAGRLEPTARLSGRGGNPRFCARAVDGAQRTDEGAARGAGRAVRGIAGAAKRRAFRCERSAKTGNRRAFGVGRRRVLLCRKQFRALVWRRRRPDFAVCDFLGDCGHGFERNFHCFWPARALSAGFRRLHGGE